mmetsp:Transcript_15888/g.43892  ORF Transcript_15888/g.43892 Transcript_15888/m.43892 type:complete len:259 (-) Transcript_15888:147-923(-)|eukprot:CAMPEP_0198120996 /NCGR_PEP_ID=MMETSP1442-20131203/30922_1 /TAXON_ID= /ORGANISM="Craspedostauros australis, Strain CCMP3328" /LENGTH=258 /DNA_ID=CAMNT_0043779741 /DNA_START=208 /DNA_END=984 /DNA_ORIENTATION=+
MQNQDDPTPTPPAAIQAASPENPSTTEDHPLTPTSMSNNSASTNVGSRIGLQPTIFEMIMSKHPLTSARYTAEAAMHKPVPTRSDNEFGIDNLSRKSLPYFLPWHPSAGPSEVPPDFSWVTNSCGGKAAIGVFGGGVMGLLMGVFLGAMSDSAPPVQVIGGKDVPQAPFREQLRTTMRATADKSLYWCRNFAFITGVFGGSECLVEKYRGKTDVWNSVISGCVTGGALQAKSGPQAAAMGCGGFAAFSLVIDSVMGHH